MKSWYTIKNKTADSGSISIHEEIALWGISAAQFLADLKAQENLKNIDLSIHSPGGNLLDGLAMYNGLKASPAKIFGRVDGIAASAASIVLMAADYIAMPEDSFLMIHNAQGGAFGESTDLREMADIMDKLQGSVVNIYQKKTGLPAEQIAEMMASETWMNANEARKLGFIDHVTDAIGVSAKTTDFNKHFKQMPFVSANAVNGISTERDLEKYLRDSGISRSVATALVVRAKTVFQGEPDNNADSKKLTDFSAQLTRMRIPSSLI